jgi:hypothetical protein
MNVTGVCSDAESDVHQPFYFSSSGCLIGGKRNLLLRWPKLKNVSKNPLVVAIVMKVPLGDWNHSQSTMAC